MTTDRTPFQAQRFGPLQGVRIISSGTIIAQPFAAAMAAEMGAEVIQIERPGIGDIWRDLEFPVEDNDGGSTAAGWIQVRLKGVLSNIIPLATLFSVQPPASARFSEGTSRPSRFIRWRYPFSKIC